MYVHLFFLLFFFFCRFFRNLMKLKKPVFCIFLSIQIILYKRFKIIYLLFFSLYNKIMVFFFASLSSHNNLYAFQEFKKEFIMTLQVYKFYIFTCVGIKYDIHKYTTQLKLKMYIHTYM